MFRVFAYHLFMMLWIVFYQFFRETHNYSPFAEIKIGGPKTLPKAFSGPPLK
jgi:hypothetical protein